MWRRSLRFAAARKEPPPAAGSERLLGDAQAGVEARPLRHSRGSGTVDPGKGHRVSLLGCLRGSRGLTSASVCVINPDH